MCYRTGQFYLFLTPRQKSPGLEFCRDETHNWALQSSNLEMTRRMIQNRGTRSAHEAGR